MKKIAKLLALTMAIVMVVAMMAGCTAKAPKSTTAEPKVEEGTPAPDTDTAEPATEGEPTEAEEPAEPTDVVTPESLMKAFDEQINSAEGMKFDMAMAMDMSIAIFGESTEMSILMDMNTETDKTNVHALVNTNGVYNDPEVEDVSMQSETYIMKEDGKMVAYTLEDGKWTKSDAGTATDASALDNIVFDDYSGFVLEETEKEYIVSGLVSLQDALKSVPPEMADSLGESMGMDLENTLDNDADVSVVYTFNKDTKELVSVTLDMADAMKKVMDAAFANMMSADMTGTSDEAAAAPAEGAAVEGAEGSEAMSNEDIAAMFASLFKFDFPRFSVTMQNVEFCPVEIVLPEEAATAVEVEEQPTMPMAIDTEAIEEAAAEAEAQAA